MIVIPDTNSKGWPLWVLMDMAAKEVMGHQYKSDEEAIEDNKKLADGKNGWQWVLNDPSRA